MLGVGKKSLTVQFVRNYFASDDEISDIIEGKYELEHNVIMISRN